MLETGWNKQSECQLINICIIIMGMLTLHVLIRIAIHGNMEFLKKYGKSGNDTEKKINDPSKERNDSSSA